DPQSNLTSYFYSEDTREAILAQPQPENTIYTSVREEFGRGQKQTGLNTHHRNPNLSLLPGDLRLSELEPDLSLALMTRLPALHHLPSTFHRMIKQYENHDYILIDLSPNLGVINQCLLLISHYFIVPIFPDSFSLQATTNLAEILKRWSQSIDFFRS